MGFWALGVSHKTAGLAIRDRLAIAPEKLVDALLGIERVLGHGDVVILSTCNRTEIYAMSGESEHAEHPERMVTWLAQTAGIPRAELSAHIYYHEQTDALEHLITVTCGLDSMLLGEPQILGQFKQAISTAQTALKHSRRFSWMLNQVLRVTKVVRTECALGAHTLTLGVAAQKLSEQIFARPEDLRVALVGAGETNELIAKHFCSRPLKSLTVFNRSPERAQQLIENLRVPNVLCRAYPLNKLADYLDQCDLLISCTNSPKALVESATVIAAMKRRKYEPMLMVDLAVPRDIDPAVGQIEQVYHYAIDDLQQVLEQNQRKRENAAGVATSLIKRESAQLFREMGVHDFAPAISLYKQQMDQMQHQLLEQHTKGLGDEEAMRLAEFSRALTAKLSHPGFVLARQIAQIEDEHIKQQLSEALLDALRSREALD